MRLAVCALSAVLLSGCSWLGMGGSNAGYGQAGGAYGVNCGPSGAAYYNGGGAYGAAGGCGVAGQGFNGAGAGYGAAGYGGQAGHGAAGYGGQAGHGAAGYGAGAGYGAAGYGGQAGYGAGMGGVGAGLAANGVGGAHGANGYTLQGFQGAYGAGGGVTTLGSNAAYGSAAYGQNVVGTQYSNGQYVQGAGVQTIQGAPYYVPQPYPAYYGAPQLRGASCAGGNCGGGALPFAIEAGVGTEFDIGGNLFGGKAAGPNGADFASSTGEVGALDAVSYDDAFKKGVSLGGNLAYDVSRNTTLIGGVGYSKRNGQAFENGTFTPGTYDASGVFTASGPVETVTAEYSDLEEWKLEGGVRQYMGYNPTFRPYVGATGGFTHNNSVNLNQTSDGATALDFDQEYVDAGWRPTAAGVIGAEMAVGPRAALGVETGIRWRDNLDTTAPSEDRWSIPVSLRGRVAF